MPGTQHPMSAAGGVGHKWPRQFHIFGKRCVITTAASARAGKIESDLAGTAYTPAARGNAGRRHRDCSRSQTETIHPVSAPAEPAAAHRARPLKPEDAAEAKSSRRTHAPIRAPELLRLTDSCARSHGDHRESTIAHSA